MHFCCDIHVNPGDKTFLQLKYPLYIHALIILIVEQVRVAVHTAVHRMFVTTFCT